MWIIPRQTMQRLSLRLSCGSLLKLVLSPYFSPWQAARKCSRAPNWPTTRRRNSCRHRRTASDWFTRPKWNRCASPWSSSSRSSSAGHPTMWWWLSSCSGIQIKGQVCQASVGRPRVGVGFVSNWFCWVTAAWNGHLKGLLPLHISVNTSFNETKK